VEQWHCSDARRSRSVRSRAWRLSPARRAGVATKVKKRT
jgi:hypothetical protein